MLVLTTALLAASTLAQQYDLVLKNGHVIDPKNNIDAVMDVAVQDGKIARVAAGIPASEGRKVADVTGLYVTPGIIDIHVHAYTGTGNKNLTGDSSLYPDPLSFRAGVTTEVDAGSSGWRSFPDFKQRVIDRAKTRVLAFINVVGAGMTGKENDDIDAQQAAAVAKQYPGVVVGFKTAHYSGEGWTSVDAAVTAGKATNLPVMVDFGFLTAERNLQTLLGDKLRPGDIYTHCFSGHRDEVVDGKLNPAMVQGRKRGVFFDVGHGAGSFYWNIAIPAMQQGFYPDSISSDLHTGSMNSGFKDMPNLMSKFLIMGMPLKEIVKRTTWNPAQQIKHPELGHLTVGAEADITVLGIEKGKFGYLDSAGARYEGNQRIYADMTVRKGVVQWDLNARSAIDYQKFQYPKNQYKLNFADPKQPKKQ
ncbi:amidohydrolase [Bryobacterales bacterium F-183]|nr:amidohydrolase [Bryobacterales bacterium F-183]